MPRKSDPNRARASEIEPLNPSGGRRESRAPSTPAGRAPAAAPRRSPRVEDNGLRLHDMEAKKEMFRRYAEWKANGGRKSETPVADLCTEYGCHRNYPKKL